MKKDDIKWLAWIAQFFVDEFHGETFTSFLRRILGIDPPRPWRWAGYASVTVFCVWFWGHMVLGWWP